MMKILVDADACPVKEIIEKANNFFDKKGLIQNITIIAVFVNLLLLFFIFITLLLRG